MDLNTATSDEQKRVVMVIEDEGLLLQAVSRKLQNRGVETVTCEGGKQALDYLNTLSKLPDIIWLDFHLKDMNGVQFMNEIKKNVQWKDIPVVVVSNTASDKNIHDVMTLGVQKYIVKADQKLDDIIELIISMVNKKEKPTIN